MANFIRHIHKPGNDLFGQIAQCLFSGISRQIRSGFSLIEIIIVTGSLALLFSLISVNLLSASQQATLSTITDTLISDLRTQQLKAMVGDTEGRVASDRYGIHFDEDSYTLFHGSFYNSADPTNFTIEMPEIMIITSVSLLNDEVIFERGSGEIVGFIGGQDSVSVRNTETNEEQVVRLNRMGTLVSLP